MPSSVADFMRPPIVLNEDAQMGMVEAQLKMGDVRHVLIIDDTGRLSGILSRGDVLRAQAREGHQFVRDFMTRRLFTLPPDAPAVAAIDLMLERGVGAVPIIAADGKPVGIVGEVDFLKVVRQTLAG